MSDQNEDFAELSNRIKQQEETLSRLVEIIAAINQRIPDLKR